ncbi:radical SAM protein [Streptomyces rimosus]|uniref:B12-binding domain-containing radical SAM protein n=1 Tax=Streptomyces rimosus TaxID=1927 RepID=UPI0007C5975F|nr:radical SAM protein [Streptomyces rimosus]
MRILLVSGLGPAVKNSGYLAGTAFDPVTDNAAHYYRTALPGFDLSRLHYSSGQGLRPLLRRRTTETPHLTTFTLRSILDALPVEYTHVDTSTVWAGQDAEATGEYDVALLSTTFIWDRRSLADAVAWISRRWPSAVLVVGGQYSNLKYAQILRDHPEIAHVLRGDAEEALPALLQAVAGRQDLTEVPNLVTRDDAGRPASTPLTYIDLEAHPSPGFHLKAPIVPYESMRGCPFACGFCSFPHASPQWRYKSAEKIFGDWARYADRTGARHIKAMDSTFTVPPTRLRALCDLLPALDLGWEAYSRANSIKTPDDVRRLTDAHCRSLSIGFESMSEQTLRDMDKKVTARHNRNAFELLHGSPVDYRCSFMAGYPGETPEEFARTRNFLAEDYAGYFLLSVFSLQDETMPVWQRAREFGLVVDDPDDADYSWRHHGMDEPTARALVTDTLDTVRTRNDDAVLILWQGGYEHPPMPDYSRPHNRRVEKTIERLGMLPRDEPDPTRARDRAATWLRELTDLGVHLTDETRDMATAPNAPTTHRPNDVAPAGHVPDVTAASSV